MITVDDPMPGGHLDAIRRASGTPLLVAVVLAVAIVAVSPPDARAAATRIAILAVGIVAAWRFLRTSSAVTRSTPERFESELPAPVAPPSDVRSLRTIDQNLRMSTGTAFGLEFMLKPLIRELARDRLMRNRRIDMDATPELARRTAGEPLWRLIRVADAPPKYGSPGVPLVELEAAIDHLERI